MTKDNSQDPFAPLLADFSVSFRLIYRDMLDIFEYVEPTASHELVFSHRIRALLFRACAEFESLAREILVVRGSSKSRSQMKSVDYRTLAGPFRLSSFSGFVTLWRPVRRRCEPFAAWSDSTRSLPWYSDYHAAKHNRHEDFGRANLGAAVDAVSGLLVLLTTATPFRENEMAGGLNPDGTMSWYYEQLIVLGPTLASGNWSHDGVR